MTFIFQSYSAFILQSFKTDQIQNSILINKEIQSETINQ